jgi:soluble lytic murein transglycosylase-like protein
VPRFYPGRFFPLARRLPALVCVLSLAAGAHAMERVTLRNGFAYDCAHRQPIDGGRVRLFLDTSQSSYIDLPAASIESIEAIPDPPPAATPAPASAATTDVRGLLSKAGEQHNIDVELLASLVQAESAGHPRAVSRTGAEGLMQLMPGTAHQMGVADAFQPAQNIGGGTAYLDLLLDRYHDDLALALAAYNAGPAAVDRYHGIPPYRETRAYVARVMTEFKRRKLASEKTTLASR